MAKGSTVGTAYVQILPTTDGIHDNITNLLQGEMSKAGTASGGTLGNNLFKSFLASNAVMKICDLIVSGIQKAASMAFNFLKDVIGLYGEYEQLAGGAQKIFDEIDYSKIYNDAKGAYKELNLSMNDYLESINLVGATFTSTMGDEKAYETARIGMKAISDYATGTGKSVDLLNEKYQMISRSTTSYQSIADQFSGILPQTSADFLSAAQNAGLLSDSYKNLTEVPVAEYQQAVTEMLALGVDQLGLTDNTVKESTNTVTGSIATFKAAWENLKTGLGDPSADVQQLTQDVVDAAGTMVENILPVVDTALQGIGELVKEIAPIIVEKLPALVDEISPEIESILTTLIEVATQILIDLAPTLVDACNQILAAVIETIKQNNPIIGMALEGLFVLPLKASGNGPKPFMNLATGIVTGVHDIFSTGGKDHERVVGGTWSNILGATSNFSSSFQSNVTGGMGTTSSLFASSLSGMVATNAASFAAINTDATGYTDFTEQAVTDAWANISTNTQESSSAAYEAASSNFANMETDVSTKFGNMDTTVGQSLSNISKNNNTTMDTIWTKMSTSWNNASSKTSSTWESIRAKIAEKASSSQSKVSSAWSSVSSNTSSSWSSASTSVAGRLADMLSSVSSKSQSIYSKISTSFSSMTNLMTSPFDKAKDAIGKTLSNIKGLFPLSVGKIFTNLRVPSIQVSGGSAPFGIGGLGTKPSIKVVWNAKAMLDPYMFSGATIFGAGETGDEILYGRRALMRDIAMATGAERSASDARMNAILRRMDLILAELEKGHTIAVGHRDFARLVNEVS